MQYGHAAGVVGYFQHDLDAEAATVLAGYTAAAEASRDKNDYNRLGTDRRIDGKPHRCDGRVFRALKSTRNTRLPR